jgi:hypothetical protein
MKLKFESLLAEQYAKLDEADPVAPAQPAAPQGEDPNIDPKDSKLPAPGSTITAPLTPEGKVYLIDLCRRALAFDPKQVGEFDKDVISNPVTPENADKSLKDIQRIVGTS